jgi:drug/metabolite transporter superfamily protein YnfA
MTEEDRLARKRYYIIVGVNMLATAGAVLGLLIAGRSVTTGYTVFGGAVILASLYMMAVVPRWLARRWRTPPQP